MRLGKPAAASQNYAINNLSVAEYKRYTKVFDNGEKKKFLDEAEDEIVETICDIDKTLDKSIDKISEKYQEVNIDNSIKEAINNTPIQEPEIRQGVRRIRRHR